MPKLQNLARIKDTETGKYLLATGTRLYWWASRPHFLERWEARPNRWSPVGTAYKKTDIKDRLYCAALAVAWRDWYRAGGAADPRPTSTDYYSVEMEAHRAARKLIAREVEDSVVIPETWVVEEFVVSGQSGPTTVPAREWNP